MKEIAYSILDTFTFGRGIRRQIGDEKIRFPTRWSRYYEAEYEPETFAFFRQHLKAGDTVLDIGGHIGLFAVVAGHIVGSGGRVFSFEPTPLTRSVLKEVIDLNGLSETVEVRGEAVSSASGETVFFDTGDMISNANSLVKTERSKTEIPITLISVDEFVQEHNLKIDCLKIDVEGAELDVLKGARETFLKHRPSTRLGLHPPFILHNGQSLEEIWRIAADYRLNVWFQGELAQKDWFCSQTTLFDVNLIPV